MKCLKDFYRSEEWETFRKIIISERTQPDGTILDEITGKPILHKYDLIIHHKIELTEENFRDYNISLNPDNVIIVSFRTHNDLHHRFGCAASKSVYIVYGAPCAGKTTWVDSVADPGDLILDIDRLWGAVRCGSCGQHEKPDALKAVVFDLRDCILEDIRTRRGKWNNAYVIGGYPMVAERERLQDRIGADKMILIDTPQSVCLQRAAQKSPEWHRFVEDWFDRYSFSSAEASPR